MISVSWLEDRAKKDEEKDECINYLNYFLTKTKLALFEVHGSCQFILVADKDQSKSLLYKWIQFSCKIIQLFLDV